MDEVCARDYYQSKCQEFRRILPSVRLSNAIELPAWNHIRKEESRWVAYIDNFTACDIESLLSVCKIVWGNACKLSIIDSPGGFPVIQLIIPTFGMYLPHDPSNRLATLSVSTRWWPIRLWRWIFQTSDTANSFVNGMGGYGIAVDPNLAHANYMHSRSAICCMKMTRVFRYLVLFICLVMVFNIMTSILMFPENNFRENAERGRASGAHENVSGDESTAEQHDNSTTLTREAYLSTLQFDTRVVEWSLSVAREICGLACHVLWALVDKTTGLVFNFVPLLSIDKSNGNDDGHIKGSDEYVF